MEKRRIESFQVFSCLKNSQPWILSTFKRLFSKKLGKTLCSHIIHSLGGEYCWIVRDCESIRLLKSARSLSVYILIKNIFNNSKFKKILLLLLSLKLLLLLLLLQFMNYINGTSELIIIFTKLIAFSGLSALTECISNKHHHNVKGNSREIFSSIVLSLSRSYYRRFFNNSAKRKFSHGCMVTTWVSRQLTECCPKRSVRLLSMLKTGHLTSAYFLTSGNSTL